MLAKWSFYFFQYKSPIQIYKGMSSVSKVNYSIKCTDCKFAKENLVFTAKYGSVNMHCKFVKQRLIVSTVNHSYILLNCSPECITFLNFLFIRNATFGVQCIYLCELTYIYVSLSVWYFTANWRYLRITY